MGGRIAGWTDARFWAPGDSDDAGLGRRIGRADGRGGAGLLAFGGFPALARLSREGGPGGDAGRDFGVRLVTGGGEGSGLPEKKDRFEAGEDAREDGGDHGVQGGGQPSPISPRRGRSCFAQAGDLSAERGGLD